MSEENNIPPEATDSSVENIIKIEQPQTEKEMEVHHHAHDPAAPHHKKNWKSYFWEFLMLFLAVFCGFLAEYQLEHKIERDREQQYVESLVADLENDQEIFKQHAVNVNQSMLMMDSMINILGNSSTITENTGELYYLARSAPRLKNLTINNRTFEQLKNSGNFRLIRNLKISNRIMNYYEKFPLIRFMEINHETEFTEYKKIAARVFDAAIFKSMETDGEEIKRININQPLHTYDKAILQELAFFGVQMSGTKKSIFITEGKLRITGAELLKYLQKEYHLK